MKCTDKTNLFVKKDIPKETILWKLKFFSSSWHFIKIKKDKSVKYKFITIYYISSKLCLKVGRFLANVFPHLDFALSAVPKTFLSFGTRVIILEDKATSVLGRLLRSSFHPIGESKRSAVSPSPRVIHIVKANPCHSFLVLLFTSLSQS